MSFNPSNPTTGQQVTISVTSAQPSTNVSLNGPHDAGAPSVQRGGKGYIWSWTWTPDAAAQYSYGFTVNNGGTCTNGTLTVAPAPQQSRPQPTSACVGDEVMSFSPSNPTAGQQVTVSVTSARASTFVGLNGPFNPSQNQLQQGGKGYIWSWTVTPTASGQYSYSFTANNGAVTCASNSVRVSAAASPNPSVTLSPTSGCPGANVTATGSGWFPNDKLAITWVQGVPNPQSFGGVRVTTLAADSSGAFSVTFQVPDPVYAIPGGNVIAFESGLLVFANFTVPAACTPSTQTTPPPTTCQFVLGFKTLYNLVPSIVGNCADNQTFAANGDALQHTTNGLLVWRKLDNWTAFTDGYHTWINDAYGVQERLNSERFIFEGDLAPPLAMSTAGSASASSADPQSTPAVFPLVLEVAERLDSAASSVCQYTSCGKFGEVLDKVDKIRDELTTLYVFSRWIAGQATLEEVSRAFLDLDQVPKGAEDAIIANIPAVHDYFISPAGGSPLGGPEISKLQVYSTLGDVHVVVDGSGFGASLPPLGTPSHNGTGVVSRGFIVIDETAQGWAAGNSSPASSCSSDGIGVTIRKWTDSEIVLGFGSNYALPFIFTVGDTVEFDLAGPGIPLIVSKGSDCEGNVVEAGTAAWAQTAVQP